MPIKITSSTTPAGAGAPELIVTKNEVKVHPGDLAYMDSGVGKTTKVAAVITANEINAPANASSQIWLKADGTDAVVLQNPDAELPGGTWIYLGRVWKVANGDRINCTVRRAPVPTDPTVKEAATYNVPSNPNLSGVVVDDTADDWTAPVHPFQNASGTGTVTYTLKIHAKNAPCDLRLASTQAPLASVAAGSQDIAVVIVPDGEVWEFKNPGGTVTIICQEAFEPVG